MTPSPSTRIGYEMLGATPASQSNFLDTFDPPAGGPAGDMNASGSVLYDYLDEQPRSSISSTPSSPTSLPYLCNTPPPSTSKPSKPIKASSPTIPSPNRGTTFTQQPLTASLSTKETKSPLPRRRPSPLVLGKAKETMGMDDSYEVQRSEGSRPQTAAPSVAGSDQSLAHELEDLSLLRKTVRQNLIARPVEVDSPSVAGSESGGSNFLTPDQPFFSGTSNANAIGSVIEGVPSVSIGHVLDRMDEQRVLVIDTRPLGSFLGSHLPASVPISIPTLISKRFQRSSSLTDPNKPTPPISWEALAPFISTQEGRSIFRSVDRETVEIVILWEDGIGNEVGKVIWCIMKNHFRDTKNRVKILLGGWQAVLNNQKAQSLLISGQPVLDAGNFTSSLPPLQPTSHGNGDLPPPPKSAPLYDHAPAPPLPPTSSPPKSVSHRPSLPSLRPAKRDLPSLSLNGGPGASSLGQAQAPSQRRTPKLSLNLDRSLRSATLGPMDVPPTPGGLLYGRNKPMRSPGLSLNIPTPINHTSGTGDTLTPATASFQLLCHEQAKLPPSPSSFGDVKRLEGQDEDFVYDGPSAGSGNTPFVNCQTFSSSPTSSSSSIAHSRPPIAPFKPSTILPNFLFLGPDITSEADVRALLALGVRRILNVAIECDDDQGLKLRERFRYWRVPMRDIVEENGVGKGMRDACDILDDARLHSAPTYVHCQAGKSRSVTVVLAYLIHANAWTLKTSYAYVAERRKGISPNIGFVAELMQFEETELGLKQSGGVHGDGERGSGKGGNKNGGTAGGDGLEEEKSNRHLRESLPPTWSSSVDTYPRPSRISPNTEDGCQEGEHEARFVVGDDREVRKNGVWVHHRRAPVDRTTLQPGRRVSKAGLESLRSMTSITTNVSSSDQLKTNADQNRAIQNRAIFDDSEHERQNAGDLVTENKLRPSPRPSPGLGDGRTHGRGQAVTPAGDGPLRWI